MKKCIESWKTYCPDYQIICWNEDNFDITINEYVKKAYKKKKWAYVTDYARLWIVYNYGGFYLDTDVELLKSLDSLRKHSLFLGCEGEEYVNTGVGFGSVAKNKFLYDNMAVYETLDFLDKNGEFVVSPCPYYTTNLLKEKGVKFPIKTVTEYNDIYIYPNEYFNPYDWASQKLKKTSNTYSIHHYSASWMTQQQKKQLLSSIIINYMKRNMEKDLLIYGAIFIGVKKKMVV